MNHASATRPMAVLLVLALASFIAATACGEGNGTGAAAGEGKLQVVATTPLLADLTRNVAGDMVEVRSLVPSGADVHSFRPTPNDSVAVSNAKLVVSNGMGLDSFLAPLLRNAMSSSAIHVVASDGLDPSTVKVLAFPGNEVEDGARLDEIDWIGEGADPHFWQNPAYTVHYLELIRDGFVRVDPERASVYHTNAASYIEKLRQLDREIVETLSAVPNEHRHLVTFHDAFGYFAARYGWKVSAFVAGDASDVTPRAVIKVMDLISQEGIPAVFAEPQFNSDMLGRAAADTGVVVGPIYSDALDSQVPTYVDMMRFNARSLLEHLR